jgi:hypothetical protein
MQLRGGRTAETFQREVLDRQLRPDTDAEVAFVIRSRPIA